MLSKTLLASFCAILVSGVDGISESVTTCGHKVDLGRHSLIESFSLNGKCTGGDRTITIRPGQSVTFEMDWINQEQGCTRCVEQLYVGIKDTPLKCLWSKNPQPGIALSGGTYRKTYSFPEAGVYEIVGRSEYGWRCSSSYKDGRNIATIRVEEAQEDICALPKLPGPCFMSVNRFYFDKTSGMCKKFIYGGCKGNSNNFETKEECESACAQVDTCALPKRTGPCLAAMNRFYFDKTSGMCKKFIYGGCKGNSNNFETKEECESACEAPEDTCALPKRTGPCLAALDRFYFDKTSGMCKKFVYGGCKGNSNNFESKEECENACEAQEDTCALPKLPGPCFMAVNRFYFDKTSGMCKKFIYGGCKGNSNNFETKEECENACEPQEDTCALPKLAGPCLAAKNRFYFDKTSGLCKKFVYGGCKGNSNNFETKEECESTCEAQVDTCALPKQRGPCLAAMNRFYFDKTSGMCKKFIYGGCKGNSNNFETKEECENACEAQVDTCALPKRTGPCLAAMNRFYFDKPSGVCKKFIYGGCRGNSNNFETREECQSACRKPEPPSQDKCALPKVAGTCKGYFRNYYYDAQLGCTPFIYGGCQGNENRFETFQQCQQACDKNGGSGSVTEDLADGTLCSVGSTCDQCENQWTYWQSKAGTACGEEPVSKTNCMSEGTWCDVNGILTSKCSKCCNAYEYKWWKLRHECK